MIIIIILICRSFSFMVDGNGRLHSFHKAISVSLNMAIWIWIMDNGATTTTTTTYFLHAKLDDGGLFFAKK